MIQRFARAKSDLRFDWSTRALRRSVLAPARRSARSSASKANVDSSSAYEEQASAPGPADER